jgi:programmed cell death protein 4
MMEQEVLNGHDTNIVPDEDQNGVVNKVSGTAGAEGTISVDSVCVEHRVKRKAKRQIKQLSKEVVTNGATVLQGTRLLKNSRRPRNGYGRGLPKKGECR